MDSKPLELRKIIQVGYRFDDVGPRPVLDASGRSMESVKRKYWATIAFWIPAQKPYKRCAGETRVGQLFPHEVQALKDGAILEHVQEFEFPEEPSLAEMKQRLFPVWEVLAQHELGLLPNNVPIDTKTPMSLQLTPIKQDPHGQSEVSLHQ